MIHMVYQALLILFFFPQENMALHFSASSARQMIHMKYQVLFSQKKINLECHLLLM